MTTIELPDEVLARKNRIAWTPLRYQVVGILCALASWQVIVLFIDNQLFRQGFSPIATFAALWQFIKSPEFTHHVAPSLQRVTMALLIASAAGIPLGVLVGSSATLHSLTNTVFQFGRMTSPLAWMPIAIIAFGVGTKPVVFLIAIAALWPIIINTAHGVRSVNRAWIRVVRMLGANRWGVLRRAIFPAIVPDILIGFRISIGVSWIVLVPAEMLGVSSGLGYFILDTRDRFNYSELMAVILVIGVLGFLSDTAVGMLQRHLSWRETETTFR